MFGRIGHMHPQRETAHEGHANDTPILTSFSHFKATTDMHLKSHIPRHSTNVFHPQSEKISSAEWQHDMTVAAPLSMSLSVSLTLSQSTLSQRNGSAKRIPAATSETTHIGSPR